MRIAWPNSTLLVFHGPGKTWVTGDGKEIAPVTTALLKLELELLGHREKMSVRSLRSRTHV